MHSVFTVPNTAKANILLGSISEPNLEQIHVCVEVFSFVIQNTQSLHKSKQISRTNNHVRVRNEDCWHGCPPDHQVNFSGSLQDFLVVRILRPKKQYLFFKITTFSNYLVIPCKSPLISIVKGLMCRAQNYFTCFCNFLSLFDWLTGIDTGLSDGKIGCLGRPE